MLIKSYKKGAPFLGSLFKVDRSIFLNEMKQAYLSTNSNLSISGHNNNFSIKNVIKSAMGEWIERNSLLYDRYPNQRFVDAFSIISGEIIKIEKDKILFQSTFNDSCGLASHLDSNSAIKAGYYEYFERQSLIHNWITRSEGTIIDYSKIKHSNIEHLIHTNYNFIDELYLIDISLHSSLKVVIGLGFGKHYKSVGLSASFDGEEAIIKTLEEMLQTYASKWTKNNINKLASYKKDDNEVESEGNYQERYMNLSPSQFRSYYYYLIKSNKFIEINDLIKSKMDYSMGNIQKVSYDLDMYPYCAFIPSLYDGLNTKIIKIFSPGGYPHMYPPLFSKEETSLTFNKSIKSFPNAYQEIPFP